MAVTSADGEAFQLVEVGENIANPVTLRGNDALVEFLAELEATLTLEGLKEVGVAWSLTALADEVLQEPPTTCRTFDDAVDTKFNPLGI